MLERHREKPGVGGYSPAPVDGTEAYQLQNMVVDRDGTFRPRPGLESLFTSATNVRGVWNHPAEEDALLFLNNGGLYVRQSGTSTLLHAGSGSDVWPSSNSVRAAIGRDSTDISTGSSVAPKVLWMAHKATPGLVDNLGNLVLVDRHLNVEELTNDPEHQGYWLASHGLAVLSTDGNTIRWSDDQECRNWSSASEIPPPLGVGKVRALLSHRDDETLILGSQGVGAFYGSGGAYAVRMIKDLHAPIQCHTAMKCGSVCVWLAPGPRLILYNGDVARIDFPINKDLRDSSQINYYTNLTAWYDAINNLYVLSHAGGSKQWLFDLDRQRWIGTWDIPNAYGGAYLNDASGTMVQQFPVVATATTVANMNPTVYTDLGSAMTCKVETEPNDLGLPEEYKTLHNVYVDGKGTWSVKLRYRNSPEDTWTETSAVSVTAPGYAYFPVNIWTERVVQLTATAAAGVFLRGVNIDEARVGLK